MPQRKKHRPSILRPKFAKNLELGFLFCLVLFCLNQTTTSFKSFTRSNYSVPKHQNLYCTRSPWKGPLSRTATDAATVAHDESGALGVVLNRPRDVGNVEVPIFDGGPVGRDRVRERHRDLRAGADPQIELLALLGGQLLGI